MSLKIFLKYFDSKFIALEKHLKSLNYTPLKIKNPKLRFPELFRLNDTDSYWTIDLREWKIIWKENHTYNDVEKFIENNLSYKNGNEILLVHDNEETHKYFEDIVNMLIAKKFNFLEIPW